jgi:hypothetical protein
MTKGKGPISANSVCSFAIIQGFNHPLPEKFVELKGAMPPNLTTQRFQIPNKLLLYLVARVFS